LLGATVTHPPEPLLLELLLLLLLVDDVVDPLLLLVDEVVDPLLLLAEDVDDPLLLVDDPLLLPPDDDDVDGASVLDAGGGSVESVDVAVGAALIGVPSTPVDVPCAQATSAAIDPRSARPS
jgi:hypothetical protein